jgi:hypothetical protein
MRSLDWARAVCEILGLVLSKAIVDYVRIPQSSGPRTPHQATDAGSPLACDIILRRGCPTGSVMSNCTADRRSPLIGELELLGGRQIIC